MKCVHTSPRSRGVSLVELIIVVSILAVLSSIAVVQYVNQKRRAEVISYVLPRVRACMADISSYCAVNGEEVYSNPVGDKRFPNCTHYNTPAGNVVMEATQVECSSSGILTSGLVKGYFSSSPQLKVVCSVDVRPFRCYLE
ncbi:hypothetical protein Thal_0041 [Thermocrinis albus DSM 14484]|uniref:Prepilin-type N-terminal cleavage/methylation domain-containing protein n=1 Tax=Thermocrinis albus (strain DSM 14484 / JCM 11386 / HI 11/12) TaxID=638303 RepID=D3SNE2_THEAH|nr:prepilin-type N-terminal cleavage/methylation domain-containing protein [Thermocrinis albus]ADC88679.1 hypothetical protein Thal_0041 [Thermocrinis albus DSM 14484]